MLLFLMILSLKGLQVLCSQYFQVLEICLSIVHISKTIVKFFERFHFGIILPVMLCKGMYNARYVITMNKSRVSQVGQLKIFPT